MKVKKGTIAIYVVALMLVKAGYWSYLSKETAALETSVNCSLNPSRGS